MYFNQIDIFFYDILMFILGLFSVESCSFLEKQEKEQ